MAAVLLTGPPGCGKTTVLIDLLKEVKAPAGGFYTKELRRGNKRWGFALITLQGQEAVLASVDLPGPSRVSRYGVAMDVLEEIGVPAILEALRKGQLVVIDEIGKMELLSPRFREAVLTVLQASRPLLGTIMLAPHPFADAIKGRWDVRIVYLTRENREQAFREALEATKDMLAQARI